MIFVLLIAIVFAVQWTYLNQEANLSHGKYYLDETFTKQDFIYGPQAYAPHASKMPIAPDIDVNGNETFYLMFVDLNATSNLNSTFPRVQVDYEISGLQGEVAFHVYGYIHSNNGISWTNRVEGDGGNGFYVISNNTLPEKTTMPETSPIDYNHVFIKVSNNAGATFNDFGNNTYYMKFEKPGGGLNSLHITTVPNVPIGQVTQTDNLNGTFYVNFIGDRTQDDFILLVAINGAISDDFQLNLKSSVSN